MEKRDVRRTAGEILTTWEEAIIKSMVPRKGLGDQPLLVLSLLDILTAELSAVYQ